MNPISHITFIVHDLDKAKLFFKTVFDAKEIYSSGNKTHSLSKELDNYETRIRTLGLEIKEGRSRMDGEAQSLYFYDFDNHLFEIHTRTLEQRLITYKK